MFLWVNIIVLTLVVFYGGEPDYTQRIIGGFLGQLLVLILVPTSYFFRLEETTNYRLIMVCTGIAASATALIDSCAIAFSSYYPQNIQTSFQIGIGFSTLIGSVYRLLTKWVFPESDVVESSLLYFYTGALTIGFCIVGYFLLLQLPISKEVLLFLNEETKSSDKRREKLDVENGLESSGSKRSSSPPIVIEMSESAKLMNQVTLSDSPSRAFEHRHGRNNMSHAIARSFPISPLASPIIYNLELERRQSERKREMEGYGTNNEMNSNGIDSKPSLVRSPMKKSSSDINLYSMGSRGDSRRNSKDDLLENIAFSPSPVRHDEKNSVGSRRGSKTRSPLTVLSSSSSSSSLLHANAVSGDEEYCICSKGSDQEFYTKIMFNESMVFLLFFSTLLCWPGLVTEVPSHSFPELVKSDWWSLLLLFIFSLFDCVGRYMVPYRMGLNKDNIWIPIFARFLLIPLLVCVVNNVIRSDLLAILIIILMGYTNGYLGTLTILLVNDCCDSDEEKANAGMITGLILNTGLVLGSTAALGFQNLVTFH